MSDEQKVSYAQPNLPDLNALQQQVRNATDERNAKFLKDYPTGYSMLAFGDAKKVAMGNMHSDLWQPFARKSWQVDDRITKFIFCQRPSVIPKEVVPKMTSLPNSVKAIFQAEKTEELYYRDQICVVTLNILTNTALIQNWTATAEDLDAADWFVLPEYAVTQK
jgi:hypothetical protein